MTDPDAAPRPPRRDATRNRERLLDITRTAFRAGEGEIRLEEVARRAGLGIGTLYRHFPTRDALIEAVYRSEVEAIATAAAELAATHPPLEALRAWMLLFVDYIATKQLIAPALNAMVGGSGALFARSSLLVRTAIAALVARAADAGEMRDDLDPLDLLRALVGVSNVANGPGWEESARRLVDILIAGVRRAG